MSSVLSLRCAEDVSPCSIFRAAPRHRRQTAAHQSKLWIATRLKASQKQMNLLLDSPCTIFAADTRNTKTTMRIQRIFDLLDWMVEQFPREDALAGKRNGVWEKYSTEEYYKYSHLLAYGLYEMGVRKGDRIVTISNNRPEWNFLDMAIGILGAVHIPVYPTLAPDSYYYIFHHCEPRMMVISNASQLRKIQPALDRMTPAPDLYTFDEVPGQKRVSDILDLGIAHKDQDEEIIEKVKKSILPSDLFSIIYTSGTTGDPKGVMLSHHNLISNFIAHAKVQINDHRHKALSFLPLCHIYERSLNYHYQYLGIGIYYAENLGTIAANLKEIQADGFCTVPRVIETIADKLFAAGRDLPLISRTIYNRAIRHGYKFDWEKQNWWYRLWLRFYDETVYSKWRDNLGGHRLVIVSGGSAIQERFVRLFSAAGMPIYEGYGMSETSPVIAVNNPAGNRVKIGTVGEILAGVEVKFSEDGEILTRGPHVMMGYYKDPQYTARVIDADGWLHTGDIGTFVDGTYLKITDRKKEIFKLSAGKYVAPQMIENKLKESIYIEQAMVIGENEKFASALLVPNFQELHTWAQKNRLRYRDNEALIEHTAVHRHFSKIIEDFNKTLAPHEQIKRFRLVVDEWTMFNGLLSPTLKLKRAVLYKKYAELIHEIYNKSEETAVKGKVFSQDLSHISFKSLKNLSPKTLSNVISNRKKNRDERERLKEIKRLAKERRRKAKQARKVEKSKAKQQEKQVRLERKATWKQMSRMERKASKQAYREEKAQTKALRKEQKHLRKAERLRLKEQRKQTRRAIRQRRKLARRQEKLNRNKTN